MYELSYSKDINKHEADDIFDVVIEVLEVAKIKTLPKTYINFLTDDGVSGTASHTGIYDITPREGDYVHLKNVKMGRSKNHRNNLKYDLILTRGTEATIVKRDEMRADIKIYPQNMQKFKKVESSSNYAPSIASKSNNKKIPETVGTLLKDFEITELEDENGEKVNYYKSIMDTNKGERIPIVVKTTVKLPEVLKEGHIIAVRGTSVEFDGTKGKLIQFKDQMYYEGTSTGKKGNKKNKSLQADNTMKPVKNVEISQSKNQKLNDEIKNTSNSSSTTNQGSPTTLPPQNRQPGLNNYPVKPLLISNLHKDITESELLNEFSIVGEIPLVQIQYDDFNKSTGCGQVIYKSYESADKALKQLDGKIIHNQRISVMLPNVGPPPLPPKPPHAYPFPQYPVRPVYQQPPFVNNYNSFAPRYPYKP